MMSRSNLKQPAFVFEVRRWGCFNWGVVASYRYFGYTVAECWTSRGAERVVKRLNDWLAKHEDDLRSQDEYDSRVMQFIKQLMNGGFLAQDQ